MCPFLSHKLIDFYTNDMVLQPLRSEHLRRLARRDCCAFFAGCKRKENRVMMERRKKEEENAEMRRKIKRQEGENEEIVGLWAKLQREGVRKRQEEMFLV